MTGSAPLPPPPPSPAPGSEAWRQVRTPLPRPASSAGALLLLVGSGMLLISLALPRLTVTQGPLRATLQPGSMPTTAVLLVLSLCELVCAVGMLRGASGPLPSALAVAIVAIVALRSMNTLRLADAFRYGGYDVSLGPGVILAGVAGASLLVGGLLSWRPRR